MAQFTLLGRLKLLMNNEGAFGSKNPVQGKLNGGGRSNGVLGFGDFCSIFPINFSENDARRNGYLRKVRILASSSCRSNASKSVNGNVDSNPSSRDEGFCDFDEFDEGDDDLSCFRGLVLDISYRPVNVVCWKRAICLEFMEKVVKRKRIRNTLSRKNILHRDDYMCQYCYERNSLTIDHVVPNSRGGKWEWENLVTACAKCNSKKGQKTLEEANMSLMKVPKAPKEYDILAIPLTSAAIRMLKMRKGTPQEWHQYLPK